MKRLASSALVALTATLAITSNLQAQQVCDAALVKSTYNSFVSDQMDWRLATLVSEKDYNEIKQEAGGNAVIYGIPVGANYSEFQSSLHQKLQTYNESLTRNQLRNILWTGLDPNSPSAYSDCLRAQVFASRGLHMAVKGATTTDISLLVRWNPQGADPANIPLTWNWQGANAAPLPKSVQQGETTVVVSRPKQQRTLAVNYKGFSDSAVLEPLAKLPPLPPIKPMVNTTEVYWSDEAASGHCKDFGAWASVCSADKPEGWTIVSQIFELTGDRAGCAYAECGPVSPPTATKACYHFRTQGHDEECGHAGNTGIHYSKGKLTVVWAHR
jgi:hypothetical protein